MRNESKMSALATLLQKMRGVPFPEGRLAEPGASTGCCITTSSPTDAILVRSGTKEVEIKPSEVNRLEPGAAQINTEKDLDPLHPTPNSRARKLKTSPTQVPSFKFPQPDPGPAPYSQTPSVQRFKPSMGYYEESYGIRFSVSGRIAFLIFSVFLCWWWSSSCYAFH